MAKRTSHRKADASRVYKSSDVHKRRVDRGARSNSVFQPTPDVNAVDEPKRNAGRTEFFKATETLSEQGEGATGRIASSTGRIASSTGRIASSTGRIGREEQPGDEPSSEAPSQDNPAQPKPTPKPRKRPSLSTKMPPVEVAPDVEPVAQDDDEQPKERTAEEARSQAVKRIQAAARNLRRSKLRTALITAAVVVLVVVIIGGVLYWNRCIRYNDKADMQGTWYVAGSVVPITIDDDAIHFTDDVSYTYSVDPAEKTIDVSLALMEGKSYYRFSNDRQYLVIAKDDSEAAKSVASQGPARLIDDFASLFGIDNFNMPEGDGVVVLERKPSVLSAIYEREASEVVAVKAAAEERARQEEEAAAKKAEEEAAAAERAAAEAEAEAERAALEEEWAAQAAAVEAQQAAAEAVTDN